MRVNDSRILYKRQSLSQALEGMWDYPLTVVEAPMGYGKTTALREFFKAAQADVLWQTVFDASEISFWQGFSRLFTKLDLACAQSLAKLGVPVDSVYRDAGSELIGSVEYHGPTFIVIDDYHILSSRNIDRFLERIVHMEITDLHIVILSRSAFGENTDELMLKGYCLCLDKMYFELTYHEIVEYCKLCGVGLKAEDAVLLHQYTEGWVSAVYLLILGYQQTGRLESQTATLNELVDKVIFQQCSDKAQDFLLVISMFDSFSLKQAKHMWPQGDAEALLTCLMAGNSFITFEHTSQTYHMHNILTGFLRQIFARQQPERQCFLWQLAGKWFLGVEEYNAAMDYFYKAADFEQLLTTIELARGAALARQPKAERIKYFAECPPEIKLRHPLAGIIYAFNLFISAELALFKQQCQEVEGYIQKSTLAEAVRRQLMGDMEVLKGITSYNNLSLMAEHFKAAWEILKGPAVFVDTKTPWTLGAPSVLYLYHRKSGELAKEVSTIKELPCYYRLAGGHGSGGEFAMEAEQYYYMGDFAHAEITAHKAWQFAKAKQQYDVALCARFLLMRLALVRGDDDYILNSLAEVRQTIKQEKLYAYMHIIDMCEGFIFACLNQEKYIPDWIFKGSLPETLFFQSHAFFYIIWDKALLISKQYHKLAGVADLHLAQAAIFPNILAAAYIYIFKAAAAARLSCPKEALDSLRKALDAAAPDGLIMPFVENSEYIIGLLAKLQAAGYHQDFIRRILEIAPGVAESQAAIRAKLSCADSKDMLTKRETQIAALVAEGLSNQAIGKELSISRDTVKKALSNIFIKLGVSNRTALTKLLIEQAKQ